MANPKKITLAPSDKRKFFEYIKRFNKARILVVGDFILDQFVWGKVERISPEAPVPVVEVQRESYMPGGSLNVANNIHALGGTVYPCGVVGRDAPGKLLLKAIRREGIETGGIVYDLHRPTSIKTRVIAHSQQVVRFDRENTNEISDQDQKKILHFLKAQIKTVDLIVIEDYGKGVVYPKLLRDIVRICKTAKKPILVDPKEKHFSYYTGVTAITPNRKEAFGAFNGSVSESVKSPKDVGRNLIKKVKCQAVLMTLGEDGMALFEKGGRMTQIPTAAQEVFDVSGAGDTVMAIFSLALAVGAKMREAAFIANLAAGIVVGKLGTATITGEELKASIENYASPKSFKKRNR